MPTRIFRTKVFSKFAERARIRDDALLEAISRLESGLFDASLGGNVFKLRIAREGGGRSGGYRVVVGCVIGDRAFFLFGFAKNDRPNIANADLFQLKKIAVILLEYDDRALAEALTTGELEEVIR